LQVCQRVHFHLDGLDFDKCGEHIDPSLHAVWRTAWSRPRTGRSPSHDSAPEPEPEPPPCSTGNISAFSVFLLLFLLYNYVLPGKVLPYSKYTVSKDK
jgi:hypothetical protein